MASEAEKLLRRVYNEFGPKEISSKGIVPLPTRKFARMTKHGVDKWYDFSRRHLMHRIAKLLESTDA